MSTNGHAVDANGAADRNGVVPTDKLKKPTAGRRDEINLAFAVLGIYGCYLTSGILQERIYSYRTITDERFNSTLFLLWVQCLVNVVFAGSAIALGRKSGEIIPHKMFAMAGTAYISAMICSIEALKYVNFPTKELGKSCKMIPVMLFGVLFAGKRYSVRDYVCVALITAGIVTFNLGGDHKKGSKQNSSYGLGLLFVSLVLDGVTGSSQDNIKKKHTHTVHEMMYWMNVWALILLTVGAAYTGEGVAGYEFCMQHRTVLRDLLGFALMAALGQNFIYFTISTFNSLVCTTITTTRKFFTILCSVLFFGHPMKLTQWGGVGMVFTGIGLNMLSKHSSSRNAKKAS